MADIWNSVLEPAANEDLLWYILDLLGIFCSKSDRTRMTARSLTVVFQPAFLTIPREQAISRNRVNARIPQVSYSKS